MGVLAALAAAAGRAVLKVSCRKKRRTVSMNAVNNRGSMSR
jgi:hypothetical protein